MSGAEVRKPRVLPADARRLLDDAYGVTGAVEPLSGERDATFAVEGTGGRKYVLKIASASEPLAALTLEIATLDHLARRHTGLHLPTIVGTHDGRSMAEWSAEGGTTHRVRLYAWVSGAPWSAVRPHTAALRSSLGSAVARLSNALAGFEHPAARREFIWDLTRTDRVMAFLAAIDDHERRRCVEAILAAATALGPRLGQLPHGVLYNDANDGNVLVEGPDARTREVVGFVDFGDALAGPTVIDLAVAIAYGVMGTTDPLAAAAEIVGGYHTERALAEAELEVLLPLVRARLAASVTVSAERRRQGSEDAYLSVSEAPAWELIGQLAAVPDRLAEYTFRAACGMEPCPAATRVRAWLERNASRICPVLAARPGAQAAALIDLSMGTADYGTLADIDDLERNSRAIETRIADAGARVGLGRWNEVRALYRAAPFRAAGNERDEYRTVHIGLDLFVPPGTGMCAPLEGTAHSFRDNDARYDYGPTIILEHRVRDEAGEFTFHTLYGHLSRDSLEGLAAGARVAAGTTIGRVGGSNENGGWPPHLHLQLICDLLGHEGEFPGVAGIGDREVWLSVSPDPSPLAGIPADGTPRPTRVDRLLEERLTRIGPSLSLAYRRPLHIVRGFMQTLFDANGQPFLDCVNNVAHVGHCHPRVVAAAAQKAVLETNTRYLHEHMVRLAERLARTLPQPLDVCFFVNSGSEANELALRLARAYTGRHGVVVLDLGYHGNTTTLVDVSPYKHDGPGGAGAPPWVRKIPMPDPYRGRHAGEPDAGRRYAGHVSEAAARLRESGFEAGAFLAESILSCGGQVVPPDGFLAHAYALARESGALCIADEVQTGLGRVGEAFWAFELWDVVPDIVTIGKPFGNGHPLAAVVTTREVADAFANGMEYFNTFGGNTTSCAVGLAVLDVIESEGLQERARTVGGHLLQGLRGLQDRHGIIGDVRGRGLFAGFELVRDRERRLPAAEAAAWLIERAREKGVLLSTDGPDHNVIKVKPPLCFGPDDAGHLVAVVDDVLSEDFFC